MEHAVGSAKALRTVNLSVLCHFCFNKFHVFDDILFVAMVKRTFFLFVCNKYKYSYICKKEFSILEVVYIIFMEDEGLVGSAIVLLAAGTEQWAHCGGWQHHTKHTVKQ